MRKFEVNKLIEKNYKQLYDYHRNTLRKSLWSLQEDKEGEPILSESLHILKNIAERPLDYLGLTSIECDKCEKVSFVYKEDEKDVEKVGRSFPNYTCPFCGKRLIDTNKNNLT